MAGERHLGFGREDTDLRRVCGVFGRQHERRLGQIELGGDRLHAFGREAIGVGDDGERIAAELPVGKDVNRDKIQFHSERPLVR